MDTKEIKDMLAGRWAEVIASLSSVPSSILDGGHHPCPKCGGTDRFNLDRDGSGSAFCNNCGSNENNCVASGGINTIMWLNSWDFKRAIGELERYLGPGKTIKPLSDETLAIRNDAYQKLAKAFPITDTHREQLQYRGLSNREIDQRGYWSLTESFSSTDLIRLWPQKVDRDPIAANVPGVLPGGAIKIAAGAGLMIPVRDYLGNIVGVQCRPDKPLKKGGKYYWLSSKKQGVVPGSQCHHASTITTSGNAVKPGVIRITEGPLKADITTSLSGIKTIAIAGVSNWRAAADEIEKAKPLSVLMAFDADCKTNKWVAAAAVDLFDHLTTSGFSVQIEDWDEQYKGIDDALAAKSPVEVLDKDATSEQIEHMRIVAAGAGKGSRLKNYKLVPSKGDDPNKAWEAEPLPVPEIAGQLLELHEQWPKSVKGMLFIPGQNDKIRYLASSNELFGWLGVTAPVDFKYQNGCIGKQEFFAELPHHLERFEAAEELPHFPPIPGHYYATQVEPGDGKRLEEFIDFFAPATEYDRELILAFTVTTFWGGGPGRRVAFGVDSVSGTGAGKSELVKRISSLSGGCYDFDAKRIDEDSLRKKLVNGDQHRVALLDNIKESCLSSAVIESLVTSSTVGGHKLHVGYTSRPNTITWAMTMNGMSLSRDLAQRTVVIRLAEPKRSGSWDDDFDSFLASHRGDVIRDIAAFFERPAAKLSKFTRWASWEKAVLARLANPVAVQKMIENRAADSDEDKSTAQSIAEYFTAQLFDLGYKPHEETIHIPSDIALIWLNECGKGGLKERQGHACLKNLVDGGSLRNLILNPSRKKGRGWLWNPHSENEIKYTLKDTFKASQREKRDYF